jgi:hypothetical protein
MLLEVDLLASDRSHVVTVRHNTFTNQMPIGII